MKTKITQMTTIQEILRIKNTDKKFKSWITGKSQSFKSLELAYKDLLKIDYKKANLVFKQMKVKAIEEKAAKKQTVKADSPAEIFAALEQKSPLRKA